MSFPALLNVQAGVGGLAGQQEGQEEAKCLRKPTKTLHHNNSQGRKGKSHGQSAWPCRGECEPQPLSERQTREKRDAGGNKEFCC